MVEACLGETPNISTFAQFQFLQPILYLKHPSFLDSREPLAHWISPAEHCGDALTYIIRDAETGELLKRSVMRPIDNNHPHFRSMRDVLATPNHDSPTIPSEVGEVGVESPSESVTSSGMPMLIKPLNVVGKQFVIEGLIGSDVMASVLDYNHVDQTCSVLIEASGEEQEMTYDDIIDFIENSDGSNPMEKFECLSGHRRKAGAWQVQVTWSDGSSTWEPLSTISVDDPVSCARYAKEHNLLNTQGWKRFRQLAKKDGRYIRMIHNALTEYSSAKAAKTTSKENIVKFGYKVPWNLCDAYKLDIENGNSKWAKAIRVEVKKLKEYDVFQTMAEGAGAPEGYSRIPLHWVFNVKHSFRHRARIVAGDHVAPIPDESPLSSVGLLKGMGLLLFLSQLNKLNLTCVDIGNAYFEAETGMRIWRHDK